MRIRDLEWKIFGSGIEKIRIRDKHPGSAALVVKYDANLCSGSGMLTPDLGFRF